MKKVIFLLFLVLLCSSVFAAGKPERINVPLGSDVNLNLHIGEVVEAHVYEGTKIYFPIEGVEADFWLNEITPEYVKGQLSVKGGKYAEKTIYKEELKKSNALKVNVYGGDAADMLIRYLYYRPLEIDGEKIAEEESVVLVFDVFKPAVRNDDGTYSFVDPGEAKIVEGITGSVVGVSDKDPYMKYFYVIIGVLVLILAYVVFFKKDGSEEDVSYSPEDDSSYVMESKSEPVSPDINVSGHVDSGVVEEKVKKKKVSKK